MNGKGDYKDIIRVSLTINKKIELLFLPTVGTSLTEERKDRPLNGNYIAISRSNNWVDKGCNLCLTDKNDDHTIKGYPTIE